MHKSQQPFEDTKASRIKWIAAELRSGGVQVPYSEVRAAANSKRGDALVRFAEKYGQSLDFICFGKISGVVVWAGYNQLAASGVKLAQSA